MDKINNRDDSDLSLRLEDEFACLSGSTSPGVWYIDSGPSTHMDFHITMDHITKCTPVGRDTIEFQRESGANTSVTNVLDVPGLGMNLISVS